MITSKEAVRSRGRSGRFQRGVGSRKTCYVTYGDGYWREEDRDRSHGGLEEAEEDDLWRRILEGGGYDGTMGLEEADSQEDDLWRRILEGGGYDGPHGA